MEQFLYLPGRLRVKIPKVYHNPSLAGELTSRLEGVEGILAAQVNPVTGKALVLFQEDKISLEELKTILLGDSCLPKTKKLASLINSARKNPLILSQGAKIVISGGILVYLVIKQCIFGPSRLPRAPFIGNLATATTIATGYPIFTSGLERLTSRGKLSYDLMITSFTLGTLFLKENILGLLVFWLIDLTNLFQTITFQRSEQAISRLIKEKQTKTWILVNGVEIPASLSDIQPGDIIVVHPREKVLVNGKIIQGKAIVSLAALKGIPQPVIKEAGDWINKGASVEEGSIQIKAESVNAINRFSPLQEWIERNEVIPNPLTEITSKYSRSLTGISLVLAGLTFLLTRDLMKSATILLIGSPSPSSLALPTAMGAALGNAANQGVLIKKTDYLENLLGLNTIYFDKTGTLTRGKPVVQEIVAFSEVCRDREILSLAAGCERSNTHPLARAIISKAREKKINISKVDNIQVVVGHGVRGNLEGKPILIGSKRFLEENQIDLSTGQSVYEELKTRGLTVVLLALDKQLLGILALKDSLRPESQEVISNLKEMGIDKVGLLTGDNERVAEKFGVELGLEPILSNALPEQKLAAIQMEQKQGRLVAMVGDGFNDCPALTKADIGITVGTGGTDLALESADIVLVDDDLRKIIKMIKLSQTTNRVIRENFLWSTGINLIGLFLTLGGLLTPNLASVIHNLSTLGTVINSAGVIHKKTNNSLGGKEWTDMNKI